MRPAANEKADSGHPLTYFEILDFIFRRSIKKEIS